jgi:hypothetical protein
LIVIGFAENKRIEAGIRGKIALYKGYWFAKSEGDSLTKL